MVDALRATKSVPGFLSAAQLLLVEVSKPFRAMQADRLRKYSPSWQKDWQKITDGDAPLFLIANEFLDALPICQFELSSKGWEERRIIWNGHAFEFNNTLTANPPETKIFPSAPIGAVVEVSEERDALVDAVSKELPELAVQHFSLITASAPTNWETVCKQFLRASQLTLFPTQDWRTLPHM